MRSKRVGERIRTSDRQWRAGSPRLRRTVSKPVREADGRAQPCRGRWVEYWRKLEGELNSNPRRPQKTSAEGRPRPIFLCAQKGMASGFESPIGNGAQVGKARGAQASRSGRRSRFPCAAMPREMGGVLAKVGGRTQSKSAPTTQKVGDEPKGASPFFHRRRIRTSDRQWRGSRKRLRRMRRSRSAKRISARSRGFMSARRS